MNRIKRLAQSYESYISVPWDFDLAAAQRVIFCMYNEKDERRLRFSLGEFELITQQAGHGWALFDLTDTFAAWCSSQRYAASYFESPSLLSSILPRYMKFITDKFEKFVEDNDIDENYVVAISGVASIFGFLKVKGLVDNFSSIADGRLLVFFPGSHENNNYRLLNAYDGWNYLAVTISANDDF